MMRLLRIFTMRLRSLLEKQHLDAELDAELRFHLENQIIRNVESGMSQQEAREAALRQFGGVSQRKEECRDARRMNWIEDLARDVRYAGRMIRKSPGFTAVAVLSLALGIGANTAIFSLIDALLLRPLPVPQADQLALLVMHTSRPVAYLSYPVFDYIRSHNQVFSSVFASSGRSVTIKTGSEVEEVEGAAVSGNYFIGLDVGPQAGRVLTDADDKPGGGTEGPVAVISDHLWATHFNRDPKAIGRQIDANGVSLTIVGVAPRDFFGADVTSRRDIFFPLNLESTIDAPFNMIACKGCWWLQVMGRRKPGISVERVQAQLDVISKRALEGVHVNGPARRLSAESGATGYSFLRERFSNPLAILMILVALVLLIACANLTSLLLARSAARHKEITVRLAVGAGRRRILRQLLTESLMLSAFGTLLGILLASWIDRFLISVIISKQSHAAFDISPDWRILFFLAVITIATTILFGLAPALRATRLALFEGLKEGARTQHGSERRYVAGRLLLTGQVALSLLLVCGAGLFAGSLFRLKSLNLGFNPNHLILLPIDLLHSSEKGRAVAVLSELTERLRRLPGVAAAGLAQITPVSGTWWEGDISVPVQPDLPKDLAKIYVSEVGPGYFAAIGTPLLAGRGFNMRDNESAPPVAIVDEKAARAYFPDGHALGGEIVEGKKRLRIIGIAGDARYVNLRDEAPRILYLPYMQDTKNLFGITACVRANGNEAAVVSAFRKIFRQIAPDVPIPEAYTMAEQIEHSLSVERLMASLTLFFGALALVLTSIGLYGTLSYSVARRTSEIGIRMALGAERRSILWLVAKENAALTIVGVAIGIAAVLAMSKLIAAMLYGVTPHDPLTLALAVVLLLAIAAAACLFPAIRATRIDPMNALRYE